MRWIVLFVIIVFVLGCSPRPLQEENAKFNISLLNASHSERFDVEKNKTIDSIAFTMLNNEDFVFDCSVFLKLDNTTNISSHQVVVGILQPGASKRVNLSFEMLYGNTSLSIVPVCKPAR